MLHAEGESGEHKPPAASALRPAPDGRDGERDEQHQGHLHDEVARVIDHHRRDGREQHGQAGAEAAKGIAQQQGGQQQQQSADDRHGTELGFGPGAGIAPAGEFGPDAGEMVKAGAVVILRVVLKMTGVLKLGGFNRQDGLIRVHGAFTEQWKAIVGADEKRDDGEDRQAESSEGVFWRRGHEGMTKSE